MKDKEILERTRSMVIDAIAQNMLITDPKTSEEIRKHALIDSKKLKERLDYYDWQNRLIDSFETKDILNFMPTEKKRICTIEDVMVQKVVISCFI